MQCQRHRVVGIVISFSDGPLTTLHMWVSKNAGQLVLVPEARIVGYWVGSGPLFIECWHSECGCKVLSLVFSV